MTAANMSSLRMDGTLPGSYEDASLKAITALSWGTTTGEANKIMPELNYLAQHLYLEYTSDRDSQSCNFIGRELRLFSICLIRR